MKTPCIAACKNNGGICSGCKRTMLEINQWQSYTDHKRDEILSTLSRHTSNHLCPSCNQPATCDIQAGKSHCWCFELEPRDCFKTKQDQHCLCRDCLERQPIS
ncbi:cysteine-rich CWC family protein [Vibrio sp. TRT 17S01]|uniref:cysteine-rich CWC family protein n=1 Tax=Vibrio sp. TRT 17S01 TaxID=3418505 RepID=UPI003CF95E4C